MLIGSPSCTAFSTWMALTGAMSKDVAAIRRAKIRAIRHIEFVIELYYEQLAGGRYFLHEHPEHATSWQLLQMKSLMQAQGVVRVCGDQCQYGQEVQYGEHIGQPVRKATGFMSNAPKILERLTRRCAGRDGTCGRSKGGRHVQASGRVAKDAARYSDGLCRAMIRGMVDEMRSRGIWRPGEEGMHPSLTRTAPKP